MYLYWSSSLWWRALLWVSAWLVSGNALSERSFAKHQSFSSVFFPSILFLKVSSTRWRPEQTISLKVSHTPFFVDEEDRELAMIRKTDNSSQRSCKEEKFTGKLGGKTNKCLANYVDVCGDYKNEEDQKLKHLQSLFDRDETVSPNICSAFLI